MIVTDPNFYFSTRFTFAHGDLYSKLGGQVFLEMIY